jgi:transcription elongation factor GreA
MGEPPNPFDEGVRRAFEKSHVSLEMVREGWLSCQKSMSRDILKKLKEQIKVLEEELHIELPRALKVAREHGDLSENAEYDAAKERQGYVNARLGQLRKRLADLSMVNFDRIPKGKVSFGSQVTLYDYQKEEEVIYKLVMSEEADAGKGLISTTSPIGRALLGREEGEEVKAQTPSGLKTFEIVKLLTIHDLVDLD